MKNTVFAVLTVISLFFMGVQLVASQQEGVLVLYNQRLKPNQLVPFQGAGQGARITIEDLNKKNKGLESSGYYLGYFVKRETYDNCKDRYDLSFEDLMQPSRWDLDYEAPQIIRQETVIRKDYFFLTRFADVLNVEKGARFSNGSILHKFRIVPQGLKRNNNIASRLLRGGLFLISAVALFGYLCKDHQAIQSFLSQFNKV